MSAEGSIISCRDLDREQVDNILSISGRMKQYLNKGKKLDTLKGKVLATLFFEPSTRTRLSFSTAMERLGGSVVGFSSKEGTSLEKGESLMDTVKTVEQYADCIVIRNPMEGAARMASDLVDIPVLNGGDGSNQHPTQALLDLFTIQQEKGLKKTKVALCGDLKYGRTVHSLIYLLGMYNLEPLLVSPEELQFPEHILESVKNKYGMQPETYRTIEEVLDKTDVLYVTRIQKERFPDPNEYERIAGAYYIDKKMLEKAKEEMIVMHPLPRVDEIKTDVDQTPNAKYFQEVHAGIPVRMALLSLAMGG